ncbi:MAG: hypothetical protein J0I98_12155 [Mesorhizobium sp.]|nr:hypothetical protein [Mesorhizobium sp.]MBN9243534.1 hypothetical protein [Mesorhizobium sp.]
MRVFSVAAMGVLFGVSLAVAAPSQTHPKAASARSELCRRLSRQVDEAIETHAKATQVAAAKALQKRGTRYCAERKQAQGIRMFANALKLLGVAPVDPDR